MCDHENAFRITVNLITILIKFLPQTYLSRDKTLNVNKARDILNKRQQQFMNDIKKRKSLECLRYTGVLHVKKKKYAEIHRIRKWDTY